MAVSYPFPDTEVYHGAALLGVEEVYVAAFLLLILVDQSHVIPAESSCPAYHRVKLSMVDTPRT